MRKPRRFSMSYICSLASLLLPGTLTAPAVADELPLLRDGTRSATWEIHFLHAPFQADITYSASGRFFMVRGGKYLKVDSAGRETFSLARTAATFQPPFTHFIVEPEGLYDLSQAQPKRLPFVQVVNGEQDRQMSRDLWRHHFGRAYRKADIVFYRRSHGELHRVPAYMRIDGDWVLFYSAVGDIDFHHDYDLGASIEGYPPKFPRMTLLRDPRTGQFSAEASMIRDGEKPVPERHLDYRLPGRFEWLSYRASEAIDHITYTNIPVSFTGPAEFQITLEGEDLRFREAGVSSLLGRRNSRMSWFVLPADLTEGSPVSFLEFRPYGNFDTMGSKGVYVIRKREACQGGAC